MGHQLDHHQCQFRLDLAKLQLTFLLIVHALRLELLPASCTFLLQYPCHFTPEQGP